VPVASSEVKSFWPLAWPFDQIVPELPNSGRLLEIGPYLGKSTISWAEQFASAGYMYDIHTVDAFRGIQGDAGADFTNVDVEFLKSRSISEEDHLETFKQNVEGWSNITWEKAVFDENYTPPAGFEDPTVIWYDALHSYEAVTKFINWTNDKSSIVIIDCYDDNHPGTKQAVDEATQLMKVYEESFKGIVVLK
tara:strand:- start:69 stop:647 length:579 start_codon:yes stop_codon:yes gene_type:complete